MERHRNKKMCFLECLKKTKANRIKVHTLVTEIPTSGHEMRPESHC